MSESDINYIDCTNVRINEKSVNLYSVARQIST